MLSCTEFVPLYSELFKFLEDKEGQAGVKKYWEYISDTYVEDLLGECVKKEGLHGCWSYWSKSLNEEACDFKMVLDEDNNDFSIYMSGCPSRGLINKLSYMKPYTNYCDHCAVLYDRVLRKYGIEMYEKDFSKVNDCKCVLRFCNQFLKPEKIKVENLIKIIKNEKVIDFIKTLNKDSSLGVYEFDDKYVVKVIEYETKEEENETYELHKNHFDIHVLISGEEKILLADKLSEEFGTFDEFNDGGLFKCEKTTEICYSENEAVIIPPLALHMAGYTLKNKQKIKKAIIKIKNKKEI